MKGLIRCLLFVGLFTVTYLLVLVALDRFKYDRVSLLETITNARVQSGKGGNTLRRFREVEQFPKVDLLFLGSSHTYRGFDPRIFAAHGLTSFNMGSSGQTPLNTYFMLKKHYGRLQPKLMILEVYPLLLAKDGMESFYDLAGNTPLCREVFEMAFALKNPNALHFVVKTGIDRLVTPLRIVKQEDVENEVYVPGGYCETKLKTNRYVFKKGGDSENLIDDQVEYLEKILKFAKERNAKIVLVTQPLPSEYLKEIRDYTETTKKIRDLAAKFGVQYIDYNTKVVFDTTTCFFDKDHLTALGVTRFNALVHEDLVRSGLI